MFLKIGSERIVNLDHIVSIDIALIEGKYYVRFFEAGKGEDDYFDYPYDTFEAAERAVDAILLALPHLELLTD